MKRHLRPSIEKAMTVITIVLVFFIAMVNDMSIKFIPVYILIVGIIVFNVKIISKYGKGWWKNE